MKAKILGLLIIFPMMVLSQTLSEGETLIEDMFESFGYTVFANIRYNTESDCYNIVIEGMTVLPRHQSLWGFARGCCITTGLLTKEVGWKTQYLFIIYGDIAYGIETKVCRKAVEDGNDKVADHLIRDNLKQIPPHILKMIRP